MHAEKIPTTIYNYSEETEMRWRESTDTIESKGIDLHGGCIFGSVQKHKFNMNLDLSHSYCEVDDPTTNGKLVFIQSRV